MALQTHKPIDLRTKLSDMILQMEYNNLICFDIKPELDSIYISFKNENTYTKYRSITIKSSSQSVYQKIMSRLFDRNEKINFGFDNAVEHPEYFRYAILLAMKRIALNKQTIVQCMIPIYFSQFDDLVLNEKKAQIHHSNCTCGMLSGCCMKKNVKIMLKKFIIMDIIDIILEFIVYDMYIFKMYNSSMSNIIFDRKQNWDSWGITSEYVLMFKNVE